MRTESKQSGSKSWVKVVGSLSELLRVSHQTRQPIKPAKGINPPHVDVPASRIGRIKP